MPEKSSAGLALLMGMPEKNKEASGMPSIPLPEGFMPPDDVVDGDSFEFTARGHIKDGKLCFEEVNGVGTTAEEAMESEDEKSTENELEEYTEEEDMGQEEAAPEMSSEDRFDEAIRKTKARRN